VVVDSTSCFGPYAVCEQGICYFTDKQQRRDINLYEFRTGKARKVLSIEPPWTFNIAVSPNGRTLLYTQPDQLGSDLILVGNLR